MFVVVRNHFLLRIRQVVQKLCIKDPLLTCPQTVVYRSAASVTIRIIADSSFFNLISAFRCVRIDQVMAR